MSAPATGREGKLAENILHFARALRAAGLPVGPGRAVEAVRAVEAAGIGERADLYWALHACFVSRADQRAVFDAAFRLFWRDPQLLEKMMSVMLREARTPPEQRRRAGETRAAEAMTAGAAPETPPPPAEDELLEIDASLTFSAEERLKRTDFEQMTAEELAEARRVLAGLSLPVRPLASRRLRPSARGDRPDWRGAMRAMLRADGALAPPPMRQRRQRWPALVALCDISGSMAGYSRMLLHFLHAVANRKGEGWSKVHSFVFGTRLSNITRHLRHRDVDEALAAAGAEVEDWEGGTRIGPCLAAFNRDWSRRVLGQGAVVLLITDGLDRDDPHLLAAAADRLRLSSHRLIWLCPLLRWDGFAPKAQGVRTLLPRVDSFRPAHNIQSLESLAVALGRSEDQGERARLLRLIGEGGEASHEPDES